MKEVIQLAIDSHLAWTLAFRQAIDQERVPREFSSCGYDDACSFGKWLYSLDDDIKHRPAYRRVKDLHYRFHVEAGEILRSMRAADFGDARFRLGQDYKAASEQLLKALHDWKTAEGG